MRGDQQPRGADGQHRGGGAAQRGQRLPHQRRASEDADHDVVLRSDRQVHGCPRGDGDAADRDLEGADQPVVRTWRREERGDGRAALCGDRRRTIGRADRWGGPTAPQFRRGSIRCARIGGRQVALLQQDRHDVQVTAVALHRLAQHDLADQPGTPRGKAHRARPERPASPEAVTVSQRPRRNDRELGGPHQCPAVIGRSVAGTEQDRTAPRDRQDRTAIRRRSGCRPAVARVDVDGEEAHDTLRADLCRSVGGDLAGRAVGTGDHGAPACLGGPPEQAAQQAHAGASTTASMAASTRSTSSGPW